MIKQQFIENIIEIFKSENERGESKYDIPSIIAPLDQRLGECEEFINDLKTNNYYINILDIEEEDFYTYAKLQIVFYNGQSEEESYYDYLNFSYKIDFTIDQRDWGYCMCSEGDKDYDSRHGCCGHGCDWSAPSFSITKQYHCGNYDWLGDEHDYWNFEDNFNNITNKEKEELQKKAEINSLKEQMKCLEEKLHKLEG